MEKVIENKAAATIVKMLDWSRVQIEKQGYEKEDIALAFLGAAIQINLETFPEDQFSEHLRNLAQQIYYEKNFTGNA